MLATESLNQESSELRLCGVLSCPMLQLHLFFQTQPPIPSQALTSGIFLVVVVLLVVAWPENCM